MVTINGMVNIPLPRTSLLVVVGLGFLRLITGQPEEFPMCVGSESIASDILSNACQLAAWPIAGQWISCKAALPETQHVRAIRRPESEAIVPEVSEFRVLVLQLFKTRCSRIPTNDGRARERPNLSVVARRDVVDRVGRQTIAHRVSFKSSPAEPRNSAGFCPRPEIAIGKASQRSESIAKDLRAYCRD